MSQSAKTREQNLEAEVNLLRSRLTELDRTNDSGLTLDALRASHLRLQLVSLAATDAVWDWDLASNDVWWSDGIRSVFGYAAEEVGRDFSWRLDRIHPLERDQVQAHLQTALASSRLHWAAEFRFQRGDGSFAWVYDRAFIIRDLHGRAVRMVGAVVDFSEKHPSHGGLPQNLAFLRAVTEDTPDGIWVKDCDGRYLMVNNAAAHLVHRSPAEVLGRLDVDLFPPAVAEQVRADDLRVLTEGKTHCFEYTLAEEGGPRTLLATRSPFRDEQGQIIGVMGISHDITLRKRAEEALRESEEKFRDLVETTKEWIWASDASGHLTYSNPATENLLGYRPEELIGQDGFALLVEEDQEPARAFLARCVQARTGWSGWVLRWRHKDGSSRSLESNGAPVFDAAGDLVGFRGSDRDITGREQLERRLRHSQKLESIGRLAGGIAHEFNNLLTVILGYSDLALQTLSPQDGARNAFEAIAKAGRRAASLTAQLLAFSQQRVFNPRVFDLNAVLVRATRMFQAFLGKGIEVSTDLAKDLRPVHADPDQIEEVLLTLVLNARDALAQGGRIRLETSAAEFGPSPAEAHPQLQPGPYGVLAVHDSGCGMDEATLAHVFEPFFSTKEVGQGSGLGLAAVYGLVRQNGGHIEVQTQAGIGSTFKIYLPIATGGSSSDKVPLPSPNPQVQKLLEDQPPVRPAR